MADTGDSSWGSRGESVGDGSQAPPPLSDATRPFSASGYGQPPSPRRPPGYGSAPQQPYGNPGQQPGYYGQPPRPGQQPPPGQQSPYGRPAYGQPPPPGQQQQPAGQPGPGQQQQPPAPGGPPPYGQPPAPGQPGSWAPPGGPGGPGLPPSGLYGPQPQQQRQKGKVPTGLFLVIVLITAVICGVGGGVAGGVIGVEQTKPTPTPSKESQTVNQVVQQVLPSVVKIEVETLTGRSLGSGFVTSKDGHIVTNAHVIDSAKEGDGDVKVRFHDGESVDAEIQGSSASFDIAVLKVDRSDLQPVKFADSEKVVVGDPVIAIGAPLGLEETTTTGIVSAIDRPVHVEDRSNSFINAIQTDAAINPGNSGGPLFDEDGKVIGVNYAGARASRTSSGSIGLGFVIPEKTAQRTAKQLSEDGKSTHAVIGTTTDADYKGNGAKIVDDAVDGNEPVQEGGPADEAGLEAGDVITKLADQEINEAMDMMAAVRSHAPGTVCKVEYERDGQPAKTKVTLGEEDDEV
ncbi:MAG: PDZ domain-containing protein [Streptosporangiales bacterium]|nr:PDZ domain-containing protein [Streptosporangiales bacterium]